MVAKSAIHSLMMNEKELLVSLAEDNDDVNLLLAAIRENAKGNFQFKKMKLRRLIKKDIQIDLVFEVLLLLDAYVTIDFDDYELPILLKRLIQGESTKMIQYLIVKKFYPDFVDENFGAIVDNVKQGREPFYGLHGFDNDRDLELFYQHDFDHLQAAKDEAEINQISEWFEEAVISLDGYKKRLTGIDLPEFDRLINIKIQEPELLISPSFFKKDERSHYKTLKMPDVEDAVSDLVRALDGEGVKLALHLAYLEVGMYNIGTKPTLLDSMQRHYLTFRMQLMGTIKVIDEFIFLTKFNKLAAEYEELMEKTKKIEYEHLVKIKKLSKHIEKARAEKEQSEEEVEEAKNNLRALQNKQIQQHVLATGYEKLLSDNFVSFKICVIHDAPLLYAPFVYPDINFLNMMDVTEIPFEEIKLILLQGLGGSAKQKRGFEAKAKQAGCEVLSLHCKDERQLIMTIAHIINERRSQKDEILS